MPPDLTNERVREIAEDGSTVDYEMLQVREDGTTRVFSREARALAREVQERRASDPARRPVAGMETIGVSPAPPPARGEEDKAEHVCYGPLATGLCAVCGAVLFPAPTEAEHCRTLSAAAGLSPDQLTTIAEFAEYIAEREKVMASELTATEARLVQEQNTAKGLGIALGEALSQRDRAVAIAREAVGWLDSRYHAGRVQAQEQFRAKLATLIWEG